MKLFSKTHSWGVMLVTEMFRRGKTELTNLNIRKSTAKSPEMATIADTPFFFY